MTQEFRLTRKEFTTLLYTGRKLELIACYLPVTTPQPRIVKAQRSYGFDLERPDGKISRLDGFTGMKFIAVSDGGNGFIEVKLVDNEGNIAAHYKLL